MIMDYALLQTLTGHPTPKANGMQSHSQNIVFGATVWEQISLVILKLLKCKNNIYLFTNSANHGQKSHNGGEISKIGKLCWQSTQQCSVWILTFSTSASCLCCIFSFSSWCLDSSTLIFISICKHIKKNQMSYV